LEPVSGDSWRESHLATPDTWGRVQNGLQISYSFECSNRVVLGPIRSAASGVQGTVAVAIAGLLIGISAFHVMWREHRQTLELIVLGGLVFIFGAVGMECIGWGIFSPIQNPDLSIFYAGSGAAEKFCEMLGVSIALYGVLTFLLGHPAGNSKTASSRCTASTRGLIHWFFAEHSPFSAATMARVLPRPGTHTILTPFFGNSHRSAATSVSIPKRWA
jgi:hypothetical protein